MKLRALTETGIEMFREYLRAARLDPTLKLPMADLQEVERSTVVSPQIDVDESRRFDSKLDFGLYLKEVLAPIWHARSIDGDRGIWTFLAVAYFDQLCPVRAGARKVSADDHYILSKDWQRQYRHKVRTPFVATMLHGQNARVVLAGTLDVHGEATEQLLSRQQIYTNVALFEALDRLYVDEAGALRRGAASKTGGSLRRLGKVLRQYDLTYDLHAMNADDICGLLPKEFDRFRRR